MTRYPVSARSVEWGNTVLVVRPETQELYRLGQRELSTMSHDEFSTERPVPLALERPAGRGIMVFSSSATVLYANVAAHDFLKRLNQIERGRSTDGALPVALTHLIDKMKQVFECRPLDGDPGQLKVTRLVTGQDRPVLLQAFGLSDRFGLHRSRIVITMEEITTSVAAKPCIDVPCSA